MKTFQSEPAKVSSVGLREVLVRRVNNSYKEAEGGGRQFGSTTWFKQLGIQS